MQGGRKSINRSGLVDASTNWKPITSLVQVMLGTELGKLDGTILGMELGNTLGTLLAAELGTLLAVQLGISDAGAFDVRMWTWGLVIQEVSILISIYINVPIHPT
jgi:hypothetical protein